MSVEIKIYMQIHSEEQTLNVMIFRLFSTIETCMHSVELHNTKNIYYFIAEEVPLHILKQLQIWH